MNVHGWLFYELEEVAKKSNLQPVAHYMILEYVDATSGGIIFKMQPYFLWTLAGI